VAATTMASRLRQARPTPKSALGGLHQDVRVGRGHQAEVQPWSAHAPASLERPDTRVQVLRKRDLRQQGKGNQRKDAYRG